MSLAATRTTAAAKVNQVSVEFQVFVFFLLLFQLLFCNSFALTLFGFPLSIFEAQNAAVQPLCELCALKLYFAAATHYTSVCERDRGISVERGALHPCILYASCPCAYVYVCVCAWAVLFFGFVFSSSVNCFYAVRVMSATWCFLLFCFEIVLERIALASVCVCVCACMCFPISITHSFYVQDIYL